MPTSGGFGNDGMFDYSRVKGFAPRDHDGGRGAATWAGRRFGRFRRMDLGARRSRHGLERDAPATICAQLRATRLSVGRERDRISRALGGQDVHAAATGQTRCRPWSDLAGGPGNLGGIFAIGGIQSVRRWDVMGKVWGMMDFPAVNDGRSSKDRCA